LNAALSLQLENKGKKVVLVSKDICLRLKAKALNLFAEDYETGKVKNLDELYTGKTDITDVPVKMLDDLSSGKKLQSKQLGLNSGPGNHFYILHGKKRSESVFYSAE